MSNISSFRGLEGMLAYSEGKIGVLNNHYQFIPYTSFNADFSQEINRFSSEYKQNPDDYQLGYFNLDSYNHLEEIDWENSNLILSNNVYNKLKMLEESLPAEIKMMNKLPIEKCMSSYMGMRMLSIFGSKIRCYPVLIIDDEKPVVINFKTVNLNLDFEHEIKHLIISSPLFIKCKSEEFKTGVLKYCFDDININEISKYSPKDI